MRTQTSCKLPHSTTSSADTVRGQAAACRGPERSLRGRPCNSNTLPLQELHLGFPPAGRGPKGGGLATAGGGQAGLWTAAEELELERRWIRELSRVASDEECGVREERPRLGASCLGGAGTNLETLLGLSNLICSFKG